MAPHYSPDRSYAFEDQEQYQAPPEFLKQPTEEELQAKQKRKKLLNIGLVIILVFGGMILALVVISRMQSPNVVVPVTPTPLPTQPSSNLQRELNRLKVIVDKADPALEPFAPPPVDMEVEF